VHPKHPKKEVNDALDYADQLGFVIEQTAAGHKWGRITCACRAMFSVWSTPKIPSTMADRSEDGSTSTTTVPKRRGND
jgi:hypothetical protein